MAKRFVNDIASAYNGSYHTNEGYSVAKGTTGNIFFYFIGLPLNNTNNVMLNDDSLLREISFTKLVSVFTVIRNAVTVHITSVIQDTYSQMKFDTCGNRIALDIGYQNVIEVFDFDPVTGVVSNPSMLPTTDHIYGVSLVKTVHCFTHLVLSFQKRLFSLN